MKKNIITVTFQNAYNYGAILQCFALQKKIKDFNYDTEVLNYDNEKISRGYKAFHINRKTFFKNVIASIIKFYPKLKKLKRNKSFENFIINNIKLSNSMNIEIIKNSNFQDSIFITGSDQIWNQEITKGFDDIYTLNFALNCKKLAYAASVGNSNYVEEYKEEYKKILNRLDNISVREEDACESLNKLTEKKVERVLDPTLLISKEEWNKTLDNVKNLNNKYIVAYVVEADEEYVKIVNDLSEKTGLPVVHFGIKNPGYKNVLKSAYTEGPLEFVNYIKNAEYVVATSFHATVFSIIFNKKFFIVPHRKTGARVTNLLDLFNVKNRVFYDYDEFKDIDYTFDTNWDEVNKKLEEEREKSINWLKNAIEG